MAFGAGYVRRGPWIRFVAWSIPEALPTAVLGFAVARAVDSGFLAGRPGTGLAWLAVIAIACLVSAAGSRQVLRGLGGLVEPMRDDLVRGVVDAALRTGVAGGADDGAVARLTRQVEVVRDSFAGLLLVLRGFSVTVVAVMAGLASLAPVIVLLIAGPFLLGLAGFVAAQGLAARRQRAAALAEERLAAVASAVLAAARDAVACGAEGHAAAMVGGQITAQANAERALAKTAALRSLCFAVGGWLPLLVLLIAGPWLAARGLTGGQILGGMMYVLIGLQPALSRLMGGLGGSGLRYVITLGRLLDSGCLTPAQAPADHRDARPAPHSSGASPDPAHGGAGGRSGGASLDPAHGEVGGPPRGAPLGGSLGVPAGSPLGVKLILRGVTFAYGPCSEPVVRDLDLSIAEGEHLAVVGPSGIGKSTLARLLCGLLPADSGQVLLGGVAVADLPAARLAATRVLIPQEAYVFSATVRENLAYLRPDAPERAIRGAVTAVGAAGLLARLGGFDAALDPARLSAGERQLVALARAYLSPAPIAILDEATCHLDPAAEAVAERAFARRDGGLVVIAHRLSSALRASRILVLDGSRAVAGDHETLISVSPLYRSLISTLSPELSGSPRSSSGHPSW